MPRTALSDRPVQGVQSIERAVALMKLLAAHHEAGLALRDLIEVSGLDRTTAYRILSGLEQAGLAHRDMSSARYRLGLEAMAWGLAAMNRAPLIEQCAPAMKALARKSGDNVFLVVRSGDYSHCLHLEEGEHPVRSFPINVGSTRLLGLGVASISLLAALTDDELRQHHQRHQAEYRAREVSLQKLQRWVERTHRLGHSQIAAGNVAGVGYRFAIGSGGDAALSIIATTTRMLRARQPLLAAMLREEVAAIAR